MKSHRWTSAAARTAADRLQLEELRGKEGLFAGAKIRAEPETAQRAAGTIGPSLGRIGEIEARAEGNYRTGVDTQRAAEATGIPRLSAAAEAALAVVAAAPDEKARAGHGGPRGRMSVSQASCGPSVQPSSSASSGGRTRHAAGWRRAGAIAMRSVTVEQRAELDRVAEPTLALEAGERVGASLAQGEAESERQGQRRGLRM